MTEVEAFVWQEFAACKGMDPELFFPERGGNVEQPRAVCAECPVRLPCLEFALVHMEKFGMWGGHSERERRTMRRQRTISARAAGEAA